MSVPQLLKMAGKVISDNSPTILTSMAVAGTITTAVLAVKATPRALELIEYNERMRGEKLNKKEVIQICWKEYIPAAAVGLATITCIIASNSINLSRNAAVAGLYSLTDTAFREYKGKVLETYGEGKERKIRDAIDQDHITANPSNKEVIFTTPGDMRCYDTLGGRYFDSSAEKIKQAVNTINYRLRQEMFLPVNELYYELGMKSTELGENGWDIDNGEVEVSFTSCLDEDRPILVMNLSPVKPRRT